VPGSYVDSTYASTGAIDSRFFRGSGTGQAAAFVSGALALILQKYPALTPDQAKAMLKGAAALAANLGVIDLVDRIGLRGKGRAANPCVHSTKNTPVKGPQTAAASWSSRRRD